jgi:hypothetical protein
VTAKPLPLGKRKKKRRKAPAVINAGEAVPALRKSKAKVMLPTRQMLKAEVALLPRSLHLPSRPATMGRLAEVPERSVRRAERRPEVGRLRRTDTYFGTRVSALN